MISVIYMVMYDDLELIGYCDTRTAAESVVDTYKKNRASSAQHWYIEDLERITLEE